MTMPKGWKPSTNLSYTSNKSRITISNNKNSDKNREIKKALIIGVSQYDNLPQLGLCKNDAEEMYEVLQSQGYEIGEYQKLVRYVTFNDLWDKIHDFFQDPFLKSKDTLFFYFSGHGVPDGHENYLASSEIEENRPSRRGLAFDKLTSLTEGCNSRRIIAILDCCFSGSIRVEPVKSGTGGRIGDDDTSIAKKARETMEKRIKESEGLCFLASSLSYQQSLIKKNLGHSLYTYYLLEGLKGQLGYVDDNGYVTADHLSRYVYDKLIDEAQDLQKPIKKSNISGDLIVAHYPNLVKKLEKQPKFNEDYAKYYPSNDISSLNAKGFTLYDQGRYQEAIMYFENALQLDPHNISIRYNRFLTLQKIQKEGISQEIDFFPQLPKLSPEVWHFLLRYIVERKCIPIIGDSVLEFFNQPNDDIYVTRKEISIKLAKENNYSFKDFYKLPKVAEFLAIKYDNMMPKKAVCNELRRMSQPNFSLEKFKNSPHAILAQLDLPIYITTNYDHLLEEALKSQGKEPISDFCRWNDELCDYANDNEINTKLYKNKELEIRRHNPLVFHLLGDIDHPVSMVLTERDYSDFITFTNKESETKVLPLYLRKVLSTGTFLLIGYKPDDDFDLRAMIDGPFSSFPRKYNYSNNIAILQVPSIENDSEKNSENLKYISHQFISMFGLRVYWEYFDEFLQELPIKLDEYYGNK